MTTHTSRCWTLTTYYGALAAHATVFEKVWRRLAVSDRALQSSALLVTGTTMPLAAYLAVIVRAVRYP
jgi:hypothetical protein